MLQISIRETMVFVLSKSMEEMLASILKIKELVEQNQQRYQVILQKLKDYRNNLHENLSILEHVCAMQDDEERATSDSLFDFIFNQSCLS